MGEFLNAAWATFKTDTDRITWLLLFTLIAIFVAVAGWGKDSMTGAMAVLASSGTGAFLGLLFSIPKRVAVPAESAGGTTQGSGTFLVANTSLEEVSDWITKTIVGAGLVSWASVLARLDHAGLEVGRAVVGDIPAARACGVGLILAAAVHGGMCAYLWFSRYLPKEWRDAMDAGIPLLAAQGLSQASSNVAPPPGSPPAAVSFAPSSGGGPAPVTDALQQAVAGKYAELQSAPLSLEDWALGMFGGEATVSNEFGTRSLSASYAKVGKGVYKVTLTVAADPRPEGPCYFFLHNTFPNRTPSVGFDAEGEATLSITAWGAFTVGAMTDDGTTQLELNMSRDPAAPREFVAAG